jgi:hypothetical protein
MNPHQRIKKLGAKLADFFVKYPSVRPFTPVEVIEAQRRLVPYLEQYGNDVAFSHNTTGTLAELHLYLECQVVKNLKRLLEGLYLCHPKYLDDVCELGIAVYCLAFAALASVAEQASAQAERPPEGRAVALKLLEELQPEDNEQAPGMAWGLGRSMVSGV